MEAFVITLIVGLFAASAFRPRFEWRPWQGGFVLSTARKAGIKVIYRIGATWGLEQVNSHPARLAQHFQIEAGNTPRSETRVMP
jgi:hypothetical protein